MHLRIATNTHYVSYTGTHFLSCLCINFLKVKFGDYKKKVSKIRKFERFISGPALSESKMEITYLSQELAKTIDDELMSEEVGYSVEQLMELVGLSISEIIFKEYSLKDFPKVVIFCGPGNNGGDGLVAARHLKTYGYEVTVIYPRKNAKPMFQRLLNLLKHYDIQVFDKITSIDLKNNNLIIDAIFGFSFHGEPRNPFDEIIKSINNSKKPVVSIDVPSGLSIDLGTQSEHCVKSEMNISLMLPKLGIKNYEKKHYLSGRFIPNSIIKKYNLKVPQFPGECSFVLL